MADLLARLADRCGRRRWLTIAVWAALLVAAAPVAGSVADRLSSGGFEVPGSQSIHVNEVLDAAGRGAQPFTFVVTAPDAAQAEARLAEVRAEASRRFPQISFPGPPIASPDGTTVALTGYAPVSQDAALDLAGDIRPVLELTDGDVRTYLLGPGATYRTFQDVTTEDIAEAETLGLPVVAIVLIALFGALVAALLPLALGVVAVTITLGLVALVADQTEVSIYAQTMTTMIGLGVAVDYSLFILARFREELAAGAERDAAVRQAMRTSGTAVAFSGLTVIVALGTVWLVPVRAVQSMAAAAMLVTAVAVLAAATLLPALLHLLGPGVDRLRIPFPRRRRSHDDAFWHLHTARVMRHPGRWLLGGSLLLVVLALPLLDLRTLNTSTAQLPADEPVVVGEHLLEDEITGPGQGTGGRLTVTFEPWTAGATPGPALDALASRVAAVPGVGDVAWEPLGDVLLLHAGLEVAPESLEAVERVVPAVRAAVQADPRTTEGITVSVGGLAAFQADLNEEIVGKLWVVAAALLGLAYLILLVLLRSLLLPLKAVLLNLLSIGAAYGVLVAVFQWGWLDFLGYDSLGTITPLTLPLIMTITFGLSMDYEVFMLSRIKERFEVHGDNGRAVAEGLESSAGVITSAAAIMVAVFGAFVLTGVPAIKEIGLGLAVAILIDATITRLVLVPASMRLLGRWNWWLPAWLDRVLPDVVHERAASAQP